MQSFNCVVSFQNALIVPVSLFIVNNFSCQAINYKLEEQILKYVRSRYETTIIFLTLSLRLLMPGTAFQCYGYF